MDSTNPKRRWHKEAALVEWPPGDKGDKIKSKLAGKILSEGEIIFNQFIL
jgi:hypothetical protein